MSSKSSTPKRPARRRFAHVPLAVAVLSALAALIWPFLAPTTSLLIIDRQDGGDQLSRVVKDYVTAVYARDFEEAYRYLSSDDRKVKDRESYVREKGSYGGFTLRLAKKLGENIDLEALDRKQSGNRAQVKVRFKVPSPEDLSPILFGWDSDTLNSLPTTEQQRLLDRLEELRRDGRLIPVEAQETYNLVREGSNWKIFFDWASGIKVAFAFSAPPSSRIEAHFADQALIAKVGEPFQVVFNIQNRGTSTLKAKIAHRLEPTAVRERLEMVQCGLLSPVTLPPASEQAFSSVYIITGDFPDSVKGITLTYVLKSDP
jgi:hypothetical protein